MSGAKQYRTLWKENFADANGLIFVIDAADHLRVVVAESELNEAARTSNRSDNDINKSPHDIGVPCL